MNSNNSYKFEDKPGPLIFTYVISGSGGHVSGRPSLLSSVLFVLPYVFKPVVELILASMIFARPENYSTLRLYFLFFFLNGRHSL